MEKSIGRAKAKTSARVSILLKHDTNAQPFVTERAEGEFAGRCSRRCRAAFRHAEGEVGPQSRNMATAAAYMNTAVTPTVTRASRDVD